MSTKYKTLSEVPSTILISRLKQLARVITCSEIAINKEFIMRIPPEFDRDADLVLRGAAQRIKDLEQKLALKKVLDDSDPLKVVLET